jgi:hypothetical protein
MKIRRIYVRFEVSTAVTMKNAVFWGVTQFGDCKNKRFVGKYRLRHQVEKNLLVTTNDAPRL